MDMARAIINGWQSTYNEEGNDLGWGKHSVNNQMKHWPGDGAAEDGRESHTRDGAYNVFPGGQFWTHTLPFAACMDLPGKTGTVTAAMTNYSVGIEADGSPVGGERMGTSGQVEPSGLLPIQMPANMETVEAQFEDVPRDMECHVDSDGNTYDFAFGLDWSGVIKDERTARYNVPPIVGESPE